MDFQPGSSAESGCFHDAALDRVGGDENELRLTPGADAFALTQVAESSLAAYDCARE